MTHNSLDQSPPSRATDQRRGACPTLREPMLTGDGLLARLRPVGGVLSPSQLRSIATLAGRFGNGQIEITARGNLQVRGLNDAQVPDFAIAVEGVVGIETGTPIEISPLAGLDPNEITDARPLAHTIRAALARSDAARRLGPKVTVVIDGGGAWERRELAADVRLTAIRTRDDIKWRLEVGDQPLGILFDRDAAGATLIVLSMIAALDGRGRDLHPSAVRQRLHGLMLADVRATEPPPAQEPVAALDDGRFVAALWLPFGAVRAAVLLELADAAWQLEITELRLAPHHGLLALCPSATIARQFRSLGAGLGLVVDTADPRRHISACIGSEGCASGAIAARRIAQTLAQTTPEFFDGSFALHVSGCFKGCAHPAPALLTLVGGTTGLGVVIDGTAKDTPDFLVSADNAPPALQRFAALGRGERALGESVAACFKRLGAASVAAAVRQG